MSKSLITLFSILLLLPSFLVALPTIGLDSFLSEQYRLDPLANNDSFAFLPKTLKKSIPVSLPFPSISAALSLITSLQISVPIHVILVGPFSSSAPSVLSSFVHAAHSSSQFHVIGGGAGGSHHLSISHSLQLHPSLSSSTLSLSSAIRSHLDSTPSPLHRSSLHSVPFSLVDDIIRKDFRSQSASAPSSFFIYLLNLDPQPKPYGYSYDPTTTTDSSPAFSKCLGSIFTGAERYVWIDLAAGPVDYGPALSGDGLLPRGDFHPLSSLHKKTKSSSNEKALLADLASLVLSAYHSLLVPPLRIPVNFESSLLVQFLHVQGPGPTDPTGLDWASIERTIRDADLPYRTHQKLIFKSYAVKVEDSPACTFAISRSMNSYTSRFLFDNYTLIVSEYLDSKRLHQILSDSADKIRNEAGIGDDEEYGRVLPVYVFDLDYDKTLLLDRFHQAVAFKDMVVAVRTRVSQTVSDYSCNGRHVITQTRMLDRPIVGSVLQSMWGVSPTHLSWGPQRNATLVDYTWSVGQTPFGPFSESLSLSFVQRDAAKRNVLLTALNYTISSIGEILDSVAAHGGDRKLLKQNRHVEFVQRWNMLKYKLDKVISAMSHLDFEKGMYFLRSSENDLYAMHSIVYQASQELEASLVCFEDPPFPWASVSVAGTFVFGFFFVYAKRDKIFKSKRKQF